MLKKAFSTLWSFWGILVFVVLMLMTLPFYFIGILLFKTKAIQKVHFISRTWAKLLFIFIGIRVKHKNKYPLDKKSSYVIIANHTSSLDIPICAIATANPFKFLSKAELAKIPVLGFIINNIYITVSRKNVQDRQKSFVKMANALNEGTSVFIYPEGTRNRSNEPTKRFYDGAFKLAIETQKPIAILTILRASQLQPSDKFALYPGTIETYWEDTIETKGMKMKDLDTLKKQCQDLINQNIAKYA